MSTSIIRMTMGDDVPPAPDQDPLDVRFTIGTDRLPRVVDHEGNVHDLRGPVGPAADVRAAEQAAADAMAEARTKSPRPLVLDFTRISAPEGATPNGAGNWLFAVPSGYSRAYVTVVGPGAGGGGGRCSTAGTNRLGGGGGSSGGVSIMDYSVSPGDVLDVQIGAEGVGGIGGGPDVSDGANGASGQSSRVLIEGRWIISTGGTNPGRGGTAASSPGGGAPAGNMFAGAAGGAGAVGQGAGGGTASGISSAGGSGGGGVSNLNVFGAGFRGDSPSVVTASTFGITQQTEGGDGRNGPITRTDAVTGFHGGSGGAGNSQGPGGNGAPGVGYGSGGGGGGACVVGFVAGSGGNGGPSIARIVLY